MIELLNIGVVINSITIIFLLRRIDKRYKDYLDIMNHKLKSMRIELERNIDFKFVENELKYRYGILPVNIIADED